LLFLPIEHIAGAKGRKSKSKKLSPSTYSLPDVKETSVTAAPVADIWDALLKGTGKMVSAQVSAARTHRVCLVSERMANA
jgi:hypothetical protein